MRDKNKQPVVAAVICNGAQYLVCKRPTDKRHGGLWEFPGGKLKAGESLHDGVRRELAEELSLSCTSTGEVLYECQDGHFEISFLSATVHGALTAREHADVAWLTLPQLDTVALAPADAAFVKFMKNARS